jgi:hypothetical protein
VDNDGDLKFKRDTLQEEIDKAEMMNSRKKDQEDSQHQV